MNCLARRIAVVTWSLVALASASDVVYQLSSSSSPLKVSSGRSGVTILGPEIATADYVQSELRLEGIGARIEDLFRVATRHRASPLPGHPGLSDSFIVEISRDELRLVRIDYGFYNLAPSRGRMWIASLRRLLDGQSVFQMSEHASVPIPEDLSQLLDVLRHSEAASEERRYQMAWSLKNGDEAIQQSRDTELLLREMAVSTRRNGLCCPDAEPGSPAAEARTAEFEKRADELGSKIAIAVKEQEKRRAVILPQLRGGTLNSNGEPAAPSHGAKPSN